MWHRAFATILRRTSPAYSHQNIKITTIMQALSYYVVRSSDIRRVLSAHCWDSASSTSSPSTLLTGCHLRWCHSDCLGAQGFIGSPGNGSLALNRLGSGEFHDSVGLANFDYTWYKQSDFTRKQHRTIACTRRRHESFWGEYDRINFCFRMSSFLTYCRFQGRESEYIRSTPF